MNLKDRLRKVYRDSNKRSYSEFAEELGVSKSTIDKWMSGKVTPENKNLNIIADKFGVSIEWLLLGIGDITGEQNADFINNLDYEDVINENEFLKQQLKEKTDYIEMLKEKIETLDKTNN